ncbi:MAG: methyltransferase domain-containing protein [Nitrospira sp.]|nr:methyltransferase domain-containing protein [Nitrospira sp.]
MSPVLVNIGCGSVWHPDWINLDVRPHSPSVQTWDVGNGLPFENGQVDVCYASHVLEHFTQEKAKRLLLECHRVLCPGGIIRLAVPDLEGIVREYLRVLARAEAGKPRATEEYEWITLELLDQLVRDTSGGEMERYLRTQARNNTKYVIGRIGVGAMIYMEPGRHSSLSSESSRCGGLSIMSRIVRTIRSLVPELKGYLINGDHEALRIGRFRLSGECHQWMYDRFSLGQLITQCGFSDAQVCHAHDSRIGQFASFGLEVTDGKVRKPDSLFMEAIKPAGKCWDRSAHTPC